MQHSHEHHHGHDHPAYGEAEELATCPVMDMPVNKQEAEAQGLTRTYKGSKYYFCCNTCVAQFEANPEKYALEEQPGDSEGSAHSNHAGRTTSLNSTAVSATLHCLTGCAIGEVVGMVISTAFAWSAAPSIAISIVLAFVFGYSLTMRPLLANGIGLRRALKLAFAADTASITIMELTDNAFILAVPGAINAGLNTTLFWTSLVVSLIVAFGFAFPLNRYLISRGRGHAVIHEHH